MTNPNPQICQNGHQQPNEGSKFCIFCGTPLIIQPIQSPVQPQQTVLPQQNLTPPTPQFDQNQQSPPQQQFIQPLQPVYQIKPCQTCNGEGRNLDAKKIVCPECRWLRPLAKGYGIDPAAFQWAEDGKAMSVLRSMTPLTMAAQVVSDKVGRRWIETLFNGVLLGENQLPDVYFQAVKAARILGLTYMPDVYISGEIAWDCRTYGSDKDSFIVMGSALATSFRGDELLFLFAREMGHCRTGHALWKTVIKFLVGEQGHGKGLMGGGLFSALGKFLSPTALIEGTLEVPLMAWARQAEITADRAGLLATGNNDVVRRVLLSWSLKSPFLHRQINIDAWLAQNVNSDDDMTKLSELMTSSTPYITRRLKLMAQFAQSPELNRWQQLIKQHLEASQAELQAIQTQQLSDDVIKLKCSACKTPMRIPSKILDGKVQMAIRCPDAKCKKVTYLKKKITPAPKGQEANQKMQKEMEMNLNYD